MYKLLWHYLINTFAVRTIKSFKKALSQGTDHLAKLTANNADPVVAAMEATFAPVLQAYTGAEQNLSAALGDYKGETMSVEELFDELLETHLPYWEGQVFYHFPKGTAQALQIFPKGRTTFNEGTYEQRILAIKTLGDKCAQTPPLGPLSINVLSFHTLIASARALQQSAGEGQVALLRDLRESAWAVMCSEMYGNLGLLMHHHRTDPKQVERYFDLKLLRSKGDSGQAEEDTDLTFYLTDAVTSAAIANGTAVLTRASGVQETKQTDEKGKVQFTIKGMKAPEEVSILFSAPGYGPRTEQGPIEPGEDQEGNIALDPLAPPAP
ncbi:MAG: hypothetical protein K9J06_08025 [Flavobacteriales bacterium]|nr:hypothetical protein [Flavobacteriales bacterium]